jgi:hypothetical protein
MKIWILDQIANGSPFGVAFEEDPPPASDPAPADPPTDPPADPGPSFSYAEGVAGEGEAPEWFKGEKYATVADQAKAYKELEGKFGSFTGAPEEYTVELREELKEKGLDIDGEDPLLQKAMEWAKTAGMDQEGFNEIVNLYAMGKVADAEAWEQVKAEEMKSLGQNAQGRIDAITKWGSANLSEEQFNGLKEMAQSAEAIKTIEHLITMTRAAPLNAGDPAPGGITETELKEMQFAKDEHGRRKIHTDPAYNAEYQKKMKQFYGEGEHIQVVG